MTHEKVDFSKCTTSVKWQFITERHTAMKKLFSLLFITISCLTGRTLCQSAVDDVCRFRISGTFPHPNPERCDLFVQCVLFQSIVRECPDGMIFPPAGGSQCVPGDRNTCSIEVPQPTTTTQSPPATTTLNPNICDGIGTGAVEIPGDCTRFILCILGEGNVINCGNNEVFSPTEGSCVPGNPITCEIFTTTPTPTTTTTSSMPLPTTTTTTLTLSTTSLPPGGNICSGNDFRFVSHPKVCYRYYFCLNGIAWPRECGFSRIFVEILQTCIPGNRRTCKPFM